MRRSPLTRGFICFHLFEQSKRQSKVFRDNIQGSTKPAIRRPARNVGVKRMSSLISEETRGVLKFFQENVIRDSVIYTEHARPMDVVYALKRQGKALRFRRIELSSSTPSREHNTIIES
ncbi:hypothetical protein Mapa_002932 [Marchantia paleacea]|nr:hypothetical protein Mapa_002932 [Marchantia paleacea]